MQGLIGIPFLLAVAYALSNNRAAIRWPAVAKGLGLWLVLALFLLKTEIGVSLFSAFGAVVRAAMDRGLEGAKFVFGPLAVGQEPWGVVLAFNVLTLIVFVSSLFAVLYHLGIMQRVVWVMAIVMQRTIGVSGAESLNVAANVFMGQSEAPLTIRPYLERLTQSEIMTVMTGGMATISGALLLAYVQIGDVPVEHLLSAVVVTAPACLVFAKILVPETETPETLGRVPMDATHRELNLIAAIARGASEGMMLALMVGAVLIAFVALVALANGMVEWANNFPYLSWLPDSVEEFLGWLFAPIAWLLGVPWSDAPIIGNLLGTRLVINEFVAYARLGPLKQTLDPQAFTVASYALCGFANLGSIGVQVAGIGSLAPERKDDLAKFGLRAMVAGTLANFLTAALAGLLA